MSTPDPRLFADRLIVLDTETTGLDPRSGDRIVEIAAIELHRCLPSGREFQAYLNPDRSVPFEATRVHGLTDAFLSDKQRFAEVAGDFLAFIEGAHVIAHNAAFDIAFLDEELRRAGRKPLTMERAICTLQLARARFPGGQHSLDQLCERFGIDRSARIKHGALIDTRLLADVYIELIGGRQIGLGFAAPEVAHSAAPALGIPMPFAGGPPRTPRPHHATAEEITRHEGFLAGISDPIWLKH